MSEQRHIIKRQMIELTVRDAASQRVLSVSTIAPVHVQLPSDCMKPDGKCDDNNAQGATEPGGRDDGDRRS